MNGGDIAHPTKFQPIGWLPVQEYGDIAVYLSTKEEISHMWGIQYLCRPWRSGEEFLWQCKKARAPAARSCCCCSACCLQAVHVSVTLFGEC